MTAPNVEQEKLSPEAYVRSRWEQIHFKHDGEILFYRSPGITVNSTYGGIADWQAAYAYTLRVEEDIRLIEEEISLLRGWKWICLENNPAAMRILKSREAALAEKKRGMR